MENFTFEKFKNKYPYLSKMANYLEKNCYFFKGVLKQIEEDGIGFEFGEELCENAFILSDKNWEEYFKKVHTLIDFSLEFLRLQMHLEQTGEYTYSTFREIEENVYNNPDRELTGPWYMWALYFSEFFWVIHNKAFQFFLKEFANTRKEFGSVLEAPSGTGAFIAHFLKQNPKWKGTALDISDSSIDFTKKILKINNIKKEAFEIVKQDLFKFEPENKFDRIMCGEFLEHLEDPETALRKFKSFLKEDGEIFITVAVWAEMIDHIYLYKSAQEVRDQILRTGLKIKKELVLNVFKNAKPEQEKTPISYVAILTH